jgi:hypothetical protein
MRRLSSLVYLNLPPGLSLLPKALYSGISTEKAMVGKKVGGTKKPDTGLISIKSFEKDVKNLSEHEIKELLLINMYKNALLRAQLEALTQILIKNKITTFEEVWKDTNENFKNSV